MPNACACMAFLHVGKIPGNRKTALRVNTLTVAAEPKCQWMSEEISPCMH